jgi:methionyl-tRNA formyltransferase
MKILLLADNYVGLKVVETLVDLGEDIVGIYLHPIDYQNYSQQIADASKLPAERILIASKDWSEDALEFVRKLEPDLVLSVFWRYLLPSKFFKIPKNGCINFHLGLLPFNKGKNPNVWPIIEGTPAGVTMHYVDDNIDTGPIVCQREVVVDITDTAKDVYNNSINTFVELFQDSWGYIKAGKLNAIPQETGLGTMHYSKDFQKLGEIDLTKKYDALELINILRAKTFDNFPSAYFIHEGKKIYVRINLQKEEKC